MRLIATIEDPQVIRKILAHLGLSTEIPRPCPPWPPPAGSADLMGGLPVRPPASRRLVGGVKTESWCREGDCSGIAAHMGWSGLMRYL